MTKNACFSPAATALGLEDPAVLSRYVRAVVRTPAASDTLRLYEHLGKKHYALHGQSCIALAAQLNVEDRRATETLPAIKDGDPPLETLILSPRAARDLAAAALFSAGKKVMLHVVRGDGFPEPKAEASPAHTAPLAEHLDLDSAASALPTRPLLDEGSVLALKISGFSGKSGVNGNVGIAAWDSSKRCISVAEIHDDASFTALEGILVAMNAKEALLCTGDLSDHESNKLSVVLENCGIARTELPRSKYADGSVAVDIENLVGSHTSAVHYLDMKLAMPAVAALIAFLNLLSDSSYDGMVRIARLDHKSFMHLDTAALRALNVVPHTGEGGGGKRATLFGLLNCTKTPMGSRLLRTWLAQPLQDINEINGRLDVVEALMSSIEVRRTVRDDHLYRFPDINLLVGRFTKKSGSKATLQDVVRLYQCSVRLPYLVKSLQNADGEVLSNRFISPLDKLVKEFANFEALVETTIDLDQIDNGEFVINPNIDENLAQLRVTQDSLLSAIADEHQRVIEALRPPKSDVLKLERKDNLGYVFRVTRKDERLIRGKQGTYQVVDTRKDGVRFVTRTLKRLSAEYDEAAKEYSSKESDLRSKTLEVASTYMDAFLDVAALAGELDVLSSFATVAVGAKEEYVRPSMIAAGGALRLSRARHPMVEECLDDREFIANDLNLRRVPGQDQGGALLLITGPNTGGKSTYIRTAGVITLMAHVGSFVPAAEAIVPLTDRILCRVGAGDNQHRAVSTFMSEMLETAAILRSATRNSLIIIDGRNCTLLRQCCLGSCFLFFFLRSRLECYLTTSLSLNCPRCNNGTCFESDRTWAWNWCQ